MNAKLVPTIKKLRSLRGAALASHLANLPVDVAEEATDWFFDRYERKDVSPESRRWLADFENAVLNCEF